MNPIRRSRTRFGSSDLPSPPEKLANQIQRTNLVRRRSGHEFRPTSASRETREPGSEREPGSVAAQGSRRRRALNLIRRSRTRFTSSDPPPPPEKLANQIQRTNLVRRRSEHEFRPATTSREPREPDSESEPGSVAAQGSRRRRALNLIRRSRTRFTSSDPPSPPEKLANQIQRTNLVRCRSGHEFRPATTSRETREPGSESEPGSVAAQGSRRRRALNLIRRSRTRFTSSDPPAPPEKPANQIQRTNPVRCRSGHEFRPASASRETREPDSESEPGSVAAQDSRRRRALNLIRRSRTRFTSSDPPSPPEKLANQIQRTNLVRVGRCARAVTIRGLAGRAGRPPRRQVDSPAGGSGRASRPGGSRSPFAASRRRAPWPTRSALV